MTCQVGESDLHMLAYFPAGLTPEIFSWALALEEDRRERVTEGVTRLRESGIALRWEDLETETQGGVPCRSHVARALVRGGLTHSTGFAYRQWLGKNSFRRPALVSADAFDQVHSLGGLVFWAHPAGDDVVRYGDTLLKSGIDGMETLSQNLSPKNRKIAIQFQTTHRLGASGGSDLHIETAKRKIGQYGVETNRIDPRLQV